MNVVGSMTRIQVSVAGVTIEFIGDENLEMLLPDSYQGFTTTDGKPDLTLNIHYAVPPEFGIQPNATNEELSFRYSRNNGNHIVNAFSIYHGDIPVRSLIIDSEFRHGDLYIRPLMTGIHRGSIPVIDNKTCVVPTDLLDRYLITTLLNRGKGVILHSCGVIVNGKGILFTGYSGAGKSTMAGLWQQKEGATVLSDERVAIRPVGDHFRIYGTPWPSSAGAVSPSSAPLNRIFIIRHHQENQVFPLGQTNAVTQLLLQNFSDYGEQDRVEYIVEVLTGLTEKVPCEELGFVPDETVLDYISGLL